MPLIYEATTAGIIRQMKSHLPHALLLEGLPGVGLLTIAKEIAGHDIAGMVQPTDTKGTTDLSAKGVIRVGQIRELIVLTRNIKTSRQIIIIDDTDKMNQSAQNAFLKLLEEPTPHTHFVLTAHHAHLLLPTILSRVQKVRVNPISREESERLAKKRGVTDPAKLRQLLFLAEGRPAELSRLIEHQDAFDERAKIMGDAREMIQASPYQKAIIISRYTSDRGKSLLLLEAIELILRTNLAHSPNPARIKFLDRVLVAYERILANGNVRLQLIDLVI